MSNHDAAVAHDAAIVESIYDAVTDESAWRDVVKSVATACGGFGGSLMLWDTSNNYVPVIHQFGYSDETWQEYGRHYFRIDPGAAVLREQPDAFLFNDHTLGTTTEVKRKHEMYDWLFKASDQRHGFGSRLFTGCGYESVLLLARSQEQGEVDREGMERLSVFVSHFRRSITLARKFSNHVSVTAFDAMPFGIAILDDLGRVSFSNRAMSRIAAERDGINLTQTGLEFLLPDEHSAYRRCVERVRRRLLLDTQLTRGALAASRPSGKRPYGVVVCPFPRRNTIAMETIHSVLVCVFDPTHIGHLTEDVLAALFDLSPAEARLAIALVKFGSLHAAAVECHLTAGSARQYMKRIFSKTGVKGQVELVALIMGSVRL